MPSVPPEGEPAPHDGSLPASALVGAAERPLGFYVHVPFCATRCGYCDFNTYTAAELGGVGAPPGASRDSYASAANLETRFAASVLGEARRPVSTVFFGGGTPTLLPPAHLVGMLDEIRSSFGLVEGAEVTTESNPDSVDRAELEQLREGGINRISFGMQSSVTHVLKVLDRTHDPERLPRVVEWARQAGFEQVSLDLIYGTPGETLADWAGSLDAALSCGPDHISAYALIVEDGTGLARRVRRGEVATPDDDEMADKYVMADEVLGAAGLGWYELSNWARDEAARCRHNLLYWRGGDWWGVGPGAHSHVGGVRWWNVRHPAAYAERLASGVSPAQAREVLDAETRRVERILLETRLVEGLPVDVLDDEGRSWLPDLVENGLVEPLASAARAACTGSSVEPDPSAPAPAGDRVALTLKGRMLADAVVRDLVP